MTSTASERTCAWLLCILERLRKFAKPGTRVLEIGCGNGEMVIALRNRGFDACGCDLQFKDGPRTEGLSRAGLLRLIDSNPDQLPFEDASFDVTLSVSVLEHVMNLDDMICEMSRVTRWSGGGLHIFPSRYRLIEPHTYVPLGTLLRTRGWLRLWASLGVKNSFQKEIRGAEVADANYHYLREVTTYLSLRHIRRTFHKEFATVKFCEDLLVSCAHGSLSNRIGMGAAMHRMPMLTRL